MRAVTRDSTNARFVFSGLVTMLILSLFSSGMLSLIATATIDLKGLYEAVFGWGAIQTGFLFSIYGLILTKSDGFIGAIRNTRAMVRFYGSIKLALTAGFMVTIASMPLLAYSKNPSTVGFFYYCVCLWFSCFVWAFLAFAHVGYVFAQLISVPDKHPAIPVHS